MTRNGVHSWAGPMRGGSGGVAAPGPGSMAGALGRGPEISKTLFKLKKPVHVGLMQSV